MIIGYLNAGTGNPWAGQLRLTSLPSGVPRWVYFSLIGTLGGELPMGSFEKKSRLMLSTLPEGRYGVTLSWTQKAYLGQALVQKRRTFVKSGKLGWRASDWF